MSVFGLLHLYLDHERTYSEEDIATLKRILDEIKGMETNIRSELSREATMTRRRRLIVRLAFLEKQRSKGFRFLAEKADVHHTHDFNGQFFASGAGDSILTDSLPKRFGAVQT